MWKALYRENGYSNDLHFADNDMRYAEVKLLMQMKSFVQIQVSSQWQKQDSNPAQAGT